MSRSLFLTIVAIIALLFGGMMFLSPTTATSAFKMNGSNETAILFRVLGTTVLPLALLNFLVRNHPASATLKAILWTNVGIHLLSLGVDSWIAATGQLPVAGVAPGIAAHIFIGLGSFIYIQRMEAT